MEIQIETNDPELRLLLTNSLPSSEPLEAPPEGVTLTLQKKKTRRALNSPEILTFILTISTSVATNLVSSWLYEHLKGRTITVRIGGKKVPVEREEIKAAIESSRDEIP
jgi:hypothetical protein